MTPSQKAQELVYDCMQIQLPNVDLKRNYVIAKIQASYCANTAKWSHLTNSTNHNYWKYVKLNTQIQPSLQGGYIDLVGGFGMNLTSGKFDQWRAYTGGRLGFINRSKYVYPLVGFEAGIDYNIEKLFIGIRATGDYRSDFIFTDGTPSMRYSGYVRIGTQF